MVSPGGRTAALEFDTRCVSDLGPDTGPYPIKREELKAVFNPGTGWKIAAIEPERIQTRYHADGAPAWLATIKRI